MSPGDRVIAVIGDLYGNHQQQEAGYLSLLPASGAVGVTAHP
jgi:hypothetical protein